MSSKHKRNRKKPNAKGRNTSETFIKIDKHVVLCDAYRSLSGNAVKLLIQFTLLFKGANNGEIYLSVRKAADFCGIATGTAQRCIKELIEKGFIIINQKGSFNLKVENATTYWLTTKANPLEIPTKEYMRWTPKKQKPVPKIHRNSIKNCDRVQNLVPYNTFPGIKRRDCNWSKLVNVGAKN